jgi:hypothetical protein
MGMGMKAPPMESWPACSALHRAWEAHRAPFECWTKAERRVFSATAAKLTRNVFFALDGEPNT